MQGTPTVDQSQADQSQADQTLADQIPQPDAAQPAAAHDNASVLPRAIADRLKRDSAGLFVAVAQQHDTGEVLMVGWMDDEALRRTLSSGRATYWSRSRQEYWRKGDTSGHTQSVREVRLDCDGDTVLLKVDQVGAACHTGTRTCFDDGLLPRGAESDPSV